MFLRLYLKGHFIEVGYIKLQNNILKTAREKELNKFWYLRGLNFILTCATPTWVIYFLAYNYGGGLIST